VEPSNNIRIRVAGVIISEDKVLLIAHKKNGDVYWLLPGGGVDYGESLTEALERELYEELNIKIDVKDIAIVSDSIDPSGERHVVNICFNCIYKSGEVKLGDDERLHDFCYFPKDEIANLTIHPPINDSIIEILEKDDNCLYVGRVWGE